MTSQIPTMLRQIICLLCLPFLATQSHGQQASGTSPIPPSLIKDGELVDTTNGFSIRIDQPGTVWTVLNRENPPFTTYMGVDRAHGLIYSVFIDRRRYAEMTDAEAAKGARGMRRALEEEGWKISKMTISPIEAPRKPSFRFAAEATNQDGVGLQLVKYATSPGRLYTFETVLPPGGDETKFLAFIQTFKLKK